MSRDLWSERINILNSVGVGMPARAEIAGFDVDPDRLRSVVREAYGKGKRGAEIVGVVRSMIDGHGSTTAAAGPPVGGGVPGEQPDNAATSGAATGEVKGAKPATDSGNKRSGTKRRKTQSRTVNRSTTIMNVSAAPEQTPQAGPAIEAVGEVSDDALLNEDRAARQLGVSPRTLWTCRKRGEIPHVRIGRKVLYRPADLRQYVAAQTRTDNPEQYRLSEEQIEKRRATQVANKKGPGKGPHARTRQG